jgi:acyl-CoA synthetase (AMP-forming)/AMP-acid ligase II
MIETIPALLREAARRWGGKPALRSMAEGATSFTDLDAQADRFAKALIGDGMQAGERIGIWAPNMWEWVAATVGAQRAGATVVPLNSRLRAAEVADVLRRAAVTRLVCIGESHGQHYPSMLRGEDFPQLRRVIVLRSDPARLEGIELPSEAFLRLGEHADDVSLREREAGVTGDTVSDILFTSGTTGLPKGAVFTHRRSVLSGHGMVNFARVSDSDNLFPLGTFAHFAGYKGGWVNGLVTGATTCWSEASHTASILDAIQSMRVSVMPATPIIWQNMLDYPDRADWDLSSLRFAATGSATIPPLVVQRMIAELQVEQVGTGYGLTESGGMVSYTRPEDPVERVAYTAGRHARDAGIRIVAETGDLARPDQPGEIVVFTKRAMLEYLDNPEATRAALTDDGWLRTGDVGIVDQDGYLRVTDRLTDMYITNGYNVYPAELERLMAALPGISQCAVIGVPDSRKGEVGHAFLVRDRSSNITDAEVIAWCRQNMAGYKVPAGVTFLEDIPRNSLGKTVKGQLKSLV